MWNTPGPFESAGRSVDARITTWTQNVKKAIKETWETYEKGRQNVKDGIVKVSNTAQDVVNKAENTFDKTVSFLSRVYSNVSSETKKNINQWVENAKNGFKKVSKEVSSKIIKINNSIVQLENDIASGAAQKITYMKEAWKIIVRYVGFKVTMDIATFKSETIAVWNFLKIAWVKTVKITKDTGEIVISNGVKMIKVSVGAAIMMWIVIYNWGKFVVNQTYNWGKFIVDKTATWFNYLWDKTVSWITSVKKGTAWWLRTLANNIDN